MSFESWEVDPSTGDYKVAKGSPVPSQSLVQPAYIRLKTKRGQWLYAPDDQYGSDFFIVQKLKGQELTGLENIAERALQPMIEDKRASDVTATVDKTAQKQRGTAKMGIAIVDAQGQVETLNLPSIGG